MPEPVFHFNSKSFDLLCKMPRKTRGLWLDMALQADPARKIQIVQTEEPLRVVKPLLDAGFLKVRTYGGQTIKGSFSISPEFFHCTSEPTMEEILLICEAEDQEKMKSL
jgi:hypothetical protein